MYDEVQSVSSCLNFFLQNSDCLFVFSYGTVLYDLPIFLVQRRFVENAHSVNGPFLFSFA